MVTHTHRSKVQNAVSSFWVKNTNNHKPLFTHSILNVITWFHKLSHVCVRFHMFWAMQLIQFTQLMHPTSEPTCQGCIAPPHENYENLRGARGNQLIYVFFCPVFYYPCPAPQPFTLSLPCSQKGPPLCIPDTCVQTSRNILICLGASAICLLYTSPHHCIGTIGVQRLAWV